jgi:superfamily II DNA/RNA helicase
VCVGGTRAGDDARALRDGCHVLVGTPGRILGLMRGKEPVRGALRRDGREDRGTPPAIDVSALHTVVVDEADTLLCGDLSHDVSSIVRRFPAGRTVQVGVFSATMPEEALAVAKLVTRGGASNACALIRVAGANRARASIRQYRRTVCEVHRGRKGDDRTWEIKAEALAEMCLELGVSVGAPAVIFANGDATVKFLLAQLRSRGIGATEHLADWRRGREDSVVLVATDALARGIDHQHCLFAFQFELPHRDTKENYVHRIGRCGRFGRDGCAITLAVEGAGYEREEFRRLEDVYGAGIPEARDLASIRALMRTSRAVPKVAATVPRATVKAATVKAKVMAAESVSVAAEGKAPSAMTKRSSTSSMSLLDRRASRKADVGDKGSKPTEAPASVWGSGPPVMVCPEEPTGAKGATKPTTKPSEAEALKVRILQLEALVAQAQAQPKRAAQDEAASARIAELESELQRRDADVALAKAGEAKALEEVVLTKAHCDAAVAAAMDLMTAMARGGPAGRPDGRTPLTAMADGPTGLTVGPTASPKASPKVVAAVQSKAKAKVQLSASSYGWEPRGTPTPTPTPSGVADATDVVQVQYSPRPRPAPVATGEAKEDPAEDATEDTEGVAMEAATKEQQLVAAPLVAEAAWGDREESIARPVAAAAVAAAVGHGGLGKVGGVGGVRSGSGGGSGGGRMVRCGACRAGPGRTDRHSRVCKERNERKACSIPSSENVRRQAGAKPGAKPVVKHKLPMAPVSWKATGTRAKQPAHLPPAVKEALYALHCRGDSFFAGVDMEALRCGAGMAALSELSALSMQRALGVVEALGRKDPRVVRSMGGMLKSMAENAGRAVVARRR